MTDLVYQIAVRAFIRTGRPYTYWAMGAALRKQTCENVAAELQAFSDHIVTNRAFGPHCPITYYD